MDNIRLDLSDYTYMRKLFDDYVNGPVTCGVDVIDILNPSHEIIVRDDGS